MAPKKQNNSQTPNNPSQNELVLSQVKQKIYEGEFWGRRLSRKLSNGNKLIDNSSLQDKNLQCDIINTIKDLKEVLINGLRSIYWEIIYAGSYKQKNSTSILPDNFVNNIINTCKELVKRFPELTPQEIIECDNHETIIQLLDDLRSYFIETKENPGVIFNGDPKMYAYKTNREEDVQDWEYNVENNRITIKDSSNSGDLNKFDETATKNDIDDVLCHLFRDINIGDIIIATGGEKNIVGYGIVTSDYKYDPNAPEFPTHYREVTWKENNLTIDDSNLQFFIAESHKPIIAPIKFGSIYFYCVNKLSIQECQKAREEWEKNIKEEGEKNIKNDKNIILYGPPGTGKTYNIVNYALAIIDEEDLKEFQAKKANQEESQEKRNELLKRFRQYKENGRIQFVTFHQSYSYEEFIEGLRPILKKEKQSDEVPKIQYEIRPGVFKAFCDSIEEKNKNYVFIIDEINRGNISKIFGELITLIEESKRQGGKESMEAILPQSQEKFSVPSNLYIIGTMNTADRSITQIDTALRRRFAFYEMMPKPEYLNFKVGSIDISKMLETINKRIEFLYDREHTIGHTYFLPLKDKKEEERLSLLGDIFRYKIIPLLQEYFFEDYEKIQFVLGDNQKNKSCKFIEESNETPFLGTVNFDFEERKIYTIKEGNFEENAYIEIYKKSSEESSSS